MRERETKLLVRPSMELPTLDQLLAGRGSWTSETVTLSAVYFDTSDLRLTRSGVSLRFRSDDGWTVKIPQADDDGLVREEHSFGIEVGDPPIAARELVLPWARSKSLVEVARIETRRERTRVLTEDGRVACEIDDDDVHGFAPGLAPIHFHEIEVETPDDGDREMSKHILKQLCAAGADTTPNLPKIVRVLGESSMTPPDLAPTPQLDRKSTATDLVRASISTAVRSLIDYDALVRDGTDPEGVHRARVATRRLRSHLHTFRPFVDEDWSEELRTELQWLGKQLGHVRDADVLLGKLADRTQGLWEDLQPGLKALTARLAAARDRDHAGLLDAMRSPRYVCLLDDLIDAARSPHMRDVDSKALAIDAVRHVTRHPWKRLRAAVKALSRIPTTPELHAVRIRVKQTRYAYEAIAPIVGKPARQTVNRLTDLQDLLGDHHDATVAIQWLHSAATDEPEPETAFVAGALATTFTKDCQRVEGTWRTAWRRVKHNI